MLHCCKLQLYISLDMRLTEISRALTIQAESMDEALHPDKHQAAEKAVSDFEEDLYKLTNNSVVGMTMENVPKRVDVRLKRANEGDNLHRLNASPAFARTNIFDDDLAAIQVHKSRLILNLPVYFGMRILNLSKVGGHVQRVPNSRLCRPAPQDVL